MRLAKFGGFFDHVLFGLLIEKWSPAAGALIGVVLATIVARLLFLKEREVGTLPLTMPAFANFSWTSKDVLNVLPQGLALAFVHRRTC